ncbi:hypothetical protein FIBSPDRAFT_142101 [Athelia psychrophila]|uniref:Uncharacterized protein n=1 Tax=Athelia psychrophila TaxID=1759441 RepID=A0A166T099_9AGAM|nr:hypothetical protein FIBSPDRAFT_142101 [Fibularhizoctonia sp. CBS 109695]
MGSSSGYWMPDEPSSAFRHHLRGTSLAGSNLRSLGRPFVGLSLLLMKLVRHRRQPKLFSQPQSATLWSIWNVLLFGYIIITNKMFLC